MDRTSWKPKIFKAEEIVDYKAEEGYGIGTPAGDIIWKYFDEVHRMDQDDVHCKICGKMMTEPVRKAGVAGDGMGGLAQQQVYFDHLKQEHGITESKANEADDWECKDCGVKTSNPVHHQKDTGHNNIEQAPRFGECINCGSPVEAPYYIEDYVDCRNCGTHFKFVDAKSLESKASEGTFKIALAIPEEFQENWGNVPYWTGTVSGVDEKDAETNFRNSIGATSPKITLYQIAKVGGESKANEDDHKKSWDKLDSIAKQGFSDIGYDQKSWDSEPEEVRAEMETVVKDNLGENWKAVANKIYKEELNKGKKSGGESKGGFTLSWDQDLTPYLQASDLDLDTISNQLKYMAFLNITNYHNQMIPYDNGTMVWNLFDQDKTMSFGVSFKEEGWSHGSGRKRYAEKLKEGIGANAGSFNIKEESSESKANEDDLDWTEDKPEGGIPFYCPLCHMTIEENATWDGVFDHNKQIHNMTDENAEILAKGFTYSNSPPTSFESKASEHGRYYTELDAEAEDIIDQWVSQYKNAFNSDGDPNAEDIPSDVWDRLEKTDGGERMNTDDVQRYMDENIDFSSFESKASESEGEVGTCKLCGEKAFHERIDGGSIGNYYNSWNCRNCGGTWSVYKSSPHYVGESKASEGNIEEEFDNWDLKNTGNPHTLSNWVDHALKYNFTEDETREFWKKKLDSGWASEADPCWKGYKQIGMKDKNGKQVPNCVPNASETWVDELDPVEIIMDNFDPDNKDGSVKCDHCGYELTYDGSIMSTNIQREARDHMINNHINELESNASTTTTESMTQMDDSSDSPSTINTARKMMKGQLDSYNDNPTPEERYEDPLITMGYPWQRGGENDFSKKYSYLDKPQVKDEIMPMVDLYHGGQRIGQIRNYNPMGHLGLVTMDAIGIEEYGALPSDYEAYINGKRIPNKWDNQVDHNASFFGENDMKDYEKYDDWDDESEVINTESWGKNFYNSLKDEYGYHNWNDNNQSSSAHDQIKLMKDLGIADKTLRQMGYDLKKDGMEGFIDRIEKELSKFGINLDKPEEQEE